jgi:serine/threonine-protein kinase
MSQRAGAAEPAEIAGRYQILQKLGAGAFGTVYKAKDRILGRMVAIKTIRLEGLAATGASLDELMNRFKREAMVSAQLKHANIVTIYDIGESEGMSYLAMEFIDGVGLDRLIAAAGRLPVERAASLGAQMADALDFAHRSNIVHRDIKPANIMVEAGDRVKVTDFGIAHVTNSLENLTATGALLGTPSYMSPEQARGSTVDGRSDLFAVGCILYEMVTGTKAFRGDSITALIFKIITENPAPMREVDPAVPDQMVQIVARALAKSPDERYQTGRELADELQRLTRAGSTPTLRQSELATAPALTPPGTLPTVQMDPTVSGRAVTRVPTSPTLKAAPPKTPGATAETELLSAPSAAVAAPPALRRATPAEAGAAVSRAARSPATAPPLPAVPGPPAKSRVGLLLGVAAAGLVIVLAAGAAGVVLLRNRTADVANPVASSAAVPATAIVAEAPPATLAEAPVTTLASTAVGPTAAPPSSGTVPLQDASVQGASRPTTAERVASTRAPAGSGQGHTAPSLGTVAPSEAAAPALDAGAEVGFLEREPPEVDGREAGERLADSYRSGRGGSFGTNRRFQAREKFPRNVAPAERRGVLVLLNVVHYQALHHQRTGQYGTFTQVLPRAVGAPNSFEHAGYRFDLTVEGDAFRVVATPRVMGLRGFVADDSGYVRFADE